MDRLLWPMVSFLSFRWSTEPVLVSYVSRQDPGSSSSLESVTDPGSDSSSDSLQWSPQYSSVSHCLSGLTFPLLSCDKSQTNNQHHPVKQHTPELQLVYPGYFLYEEKLCHEYVWLSQFKTTFILRNVPCKQTSQGSPKFIYIPITSMVGPILIRLLQK